MIEILNWDFDKDLPRVYLSIDGKRAVVHFRTEENGGQRPKKRVQEGALPIWCWDGDREEPTLEPSIQMWDAHFFIEDGEIEPAG